MRFHRLCLVLVCLVVSTLILFPGEAVAGDAPWVEVRSPNFSVTTDAGEKRGRDVALHFEQMRSVFGSLMTKANVNLAVPLQIVAFRNTKEMRQVAPLFNGKPTEVAGLFQGGQDRSFIMLDMSVEDPWAVVFHEYAHQLMNGNIPAELDPWFEEGFAEYFSTIEVDSKQARVGKIPHETYEILRQMGWMKVSDLLRVQVNSKTYNESGDHRTTFYAESSLAVHYLYDNHLIPKLSIYFDSLQVQKKTVDQSLQAALGMTSDKFDKALRDYLMTGRFWYYAVPTPPSIVPAQFTVTPVTMPDARALMADIHAHSLDYRGRALAEFQDVLKTDPNNSAALRGAGFVCLQANDFKPATDYLRRATELDSKDARVHLYYAMLIEREGERDQEASATIKKELETAIALDPKLADAYSLLGFTQAFSGEPEKGVATLKKALELSPRNEHYLFNLANALMADRKPSEAIQIFRSLSQNANPQVAAQSSQALAQAVNMNEQMQKFNSQTVSVDRAPAIVTDTTGTGREGDEVIVLPSQGPLRFLKGQLVSVDCSGAPTAIITVSSGSKSLKVHVSDSDHLVLIGADKFSCEWRDKKVAVNYRDRDDGDGDAVSLEMQ